LTLTAGTLTVPTEVMDRSRTLMKRHVESRAPPSEQHTWLYFQCGLTIDNEQKVKKQFLGPRYFQRRLVSRAPTPSVHVGGGFNSGTMHRASRRNDLIGRSSPDANHPLM
jgi:hypothetical protein